MYAIQVMALGGGWLTLRNRDKFESRSAAERCAYSLRYCRGGPTRVIDLEAKPEAVVWPPSLAGQDMRPKLSS